jgi:hypothetical protein
MTKSRDLANAATALNAVTATELGFVDGVTSAIQTQLDAKTAKSTLTTTGDIYYASAANTPARLGIGTTGQVLNVSGGVPAWTTPAGGGGMTVLATGTLSNQQLSITSISGSYQSLVLVVSNLTAGAGHDLAVRFNGDTGSNYGRGQMRVDSANGANGTIIAWDERVYFNSNVVDGATSATLMLEIPFYALANTRHLGNGGAAFKNGFNSRWEMFSGPFVWNSTDAITSIATTATNYTGTYTLYGVN